MVRAYRRRKPILELPMHIGPGKYEGEVRLTEFIWDLSAEGYADEEIGDVQDFGYYAKIPLGPEVIDDVARAAREAGVELTPEERQFIREHAGAILYEDNFGFVEAEYFDTKERLNQAWVSIEDEYTDFQRGYDEFGEPYPPELRFP